MGIQIAYINEQQMKEGLAETLGLSAAEELKLSLAQLLEQFTDSGQLDKSLEGVLERWGTRDIELDCGRAVKRRMKQLLRPELETPTLAIGVSLEIHRVVIPDPARDEVVLLVTFFSGCPLSEFSKYVVREQLMSSAACEQMVARWRCSGTLIGHSEGEQELLESALGIYVDSSTASQSNAVLYNIGQSTDYLWRCSKGSIVVPTLFSLSRFPFDIVRVDLRLLATNQAWDTWLVQEHVASPTESSSVVKPTVVPPRGFTIREATQELLPVIYSPGIDYIPEAALNAAFIIRRVPDTIFWRIMVPAFMVLALTFLATLNAIFRDLYREAIATSMLPTVLVAMVALQLTANQFIPAQSGRTLLDILFVVTYGVLILLFAALEFTPGLLGLAALGIALISLFSLAGFTLRAWYLWRKS